MNQQEIDSIYENSTNLQYADDPRINKLLDELDSLGLWEVKDTRPSSALSFLLEGSLNLINLYRKLIIDIGKHNVVHARLKEQNTFLNKQLMAREKEISELNQSASTLKRKHSLLQSELEDLCATNAMLRKELLGANKSIIAKESQWKLKVDRLVAQKQSLKEVASKSVGNYVSKDESTALLIQKYKLNEDVYKDTIRKLQDNNRHFLEEILNLKNEVVEVLCKEDKDSNVMEFFGA